MSLTRQHHVTTTSSSNNTGGGGNIDALLEDLQRSVSRPGSSLGNMTNGYGNANGGVVTTGFREFAKSTRTEKYGEPAETNREYHVEYLNPSNSTTVMAESKIPPNFESFKNVEHQKHILPKEQSGLKSYKEVQKSYQYNTNTNKTQSHTVPRGSDVTLKQNMNELDTLLNDLNHAHRTGYSIDTSIDHRTNGFSSEPLTSSTPNRGHVSRIEKKTFEEQRSHRVGDSPPVKTSDYKKELVFTGGSRDPSPARQIRDEYYYESKSSTGRSARDKSPPQDRIIYPPSSNPTSPTLGRRNLSSPGPVKYYTSTSSVRERSATPPPRTGVNQKVSSYESTYNTSSSTTNRGVTPGGVTRHPPVKTPPPYRSPSPIAFAKHPDPDVDFGGKPHDLVDFTKKPAKAEPVWHSGEPNLEKFVSATNKFGSHDRERSQDRDRGTPTPTSNYNSYDRSKFPPGSGQSTMDRGDRFPPGSGQNTLDRFPPGSGQNTLDRFPPGSRQNTLDRFPPGSGQNTLDRYPPGGSKYYQPETVTNVEESYTTSKYDSMGNPTVTHFPGGKIVEYRYKEEKTTSTKYPPTITHHFPVDEQQPLLPRPFPTASPTPDSGEQRPPKRVDELMASFSDSEYHQRTENYTQHRSENYSRRGNESVQERYIRPTPEPTPTPQRVVSPPPQSPPPPKSPSPQETPAKNPVSDAITVSTPNGKLKESIAGPPVYYPPGVELFPKTKEREEMSMSSMEKGGKGKMMAKRKAKYEYEAGGKSKEKSSSGKTVVPVCLPLCCAMPCSIQ